MHTSGIIRSHNENMEMSEQNRRADRSLFLLLFTTLLLLSSSSSALALNTTRTSTTIRRSKSEVDVLLRVKTNNKGWNVDNLLANADFTLSRIYG